MTSVRKFQHKREWLALALTLAGCGGSRPVSSVESTPPAAREEAAPVDERAVLVCLGDSLTAGHGVAPENSYPSLLQAEFDRRGLKYRVVNAGVSGDTTSGGLERLSDVIEMNPKVVLVELGANDGLRGVPVPTTKANLEEIIMSLKRAGAKVALAGMTLPRNYGPDYIREFESMYRDLAAKHDIRLVPFRLEPLLGTPGLMQADGLHPTAEGYRVALPLILQSIEPLL
jgi:acyl-CoA thioesterase-1